MVEHVMHLTLRPVGLLNRNDTASDQQPSQEADLFSGGLSRCGGRESAKSMSLHGRRKRMHLKTCSIHATGR
eukprot:1466414-Pyramimonas_sp.AAC.1